MIDAVHVVWITAGLGCDGDTIAMTAASLPSIEELVAGALPGVPRVILHNPVLAYENGDAFMQSMRDAAAGKLDPFILVIEGSIPNEKNKAEGFWAALGVDAATGQPILTCEWIDRLAPRAHAVIAAGTCATYGGVHARLDGGHRRMSERRRRVHRLHHAGLSRQVHAFHGRAARGEDVDRRGLDLRQDGAGAEAVHYGLDEP